MICSEKQTRQWPIKMQLFPFNSLILEMQIIRDHLIILETSLRDSLATPSVFIPLDTYTLPLHHLPQASHLDPQSLEKTPGQQRTRGSWKGPGRGFVWLYCRFPLFTQSSMLYVFLSLNCIGLCCPLVNQYHLSNDISGSIQQGLSRWWELCERGGGTETYMKTLCSLNPLHAFFIIILHFIYFCTSISVYILQAKHIVIEACVCNVYQSLSLLVPNWCNMFVWGRGRVPSSWQALHSAL